MKKDEAQIKVWETQAIAQNDEEYDLFVRWDQSTKQKVQICPYHMESLGILGLPSETGQQTDAESNPSQKGLVSSQKKIEHDSTHWS